MSKFISSGCENKNSRSLVSLFEHINASGVPNFQGCRIRVNEEFNLPLWRSKLKDYDDKVVCEFLVLLYNHIT